MVFDGLRPTVFKETSCNRLGSRGPFCGVLANVLLNESVGDAGLVLNTNLTGCAETPPDECLRTTFTRFNEPGFWSLAGCICSGHNAGASGAQGRATRLQITKAADNQTISATRGPTSIYGTLGLRWCVLECGKSQWFMVVHDGSRLPMFVCMLKCGDTGDTGDTSSSYIQSRLTSARMEEIGKAARARLRLDTFGEGLMGQIRLDTQMLHSEFNSVLNRVFQWMVFTLKVIQLKSLYTYGLGTWLKMFRTTGWLSVLGHDHLVSCLRRWHT